MKRKNNVSKKLFLQDVWWCALGAFGGPEAHYGIFANHLVKRRKYVTEEELVEWMSLTALLPGPSSTQTLTAIGYQLGGVSLALWGLIVWAVPSIVFMTFLGVVSHHLGEYRLFQQALRFVSPMVVSFVAVACYSLSSKVLRLPYQWVWALLSCALTLSVRHYWVYPFILLGGGLVALIVRSTPIQRLVRVTLPFRYLVIGVILAIVLPMVSYMTKWQIVVLFDQFYRFGYSVIGGGQVVLPMMYDSLVNQWEYITADQFMTGLGFAQGVPGPMFSFSAFVGTLSAQEQALSKQVLSGFVSGGAIFLPGTLWILAIAPLWEKIKHHSMLQEAMTGVSAGACGMIGAMAITLLGQVAPEPLNMIVVLCVAALLLSKRLPTQLIIAFVLLLGAVIR